MNKPNFKFEKSLWKRGLQFVAGCDEVGRGCFAGPVVAGCVVFSRHVQGSTPHVLQVRIDDSKMLTPLQRLRADIWIKENALSWGIGVTSAFLINKLGIVKATHLSFRRAIAGANDRLNFKRPNSSKIEHLLIDAFNIPNVRGLSKKSQLAIIKGDGKSFSIAAASIIAKVYRDGLMNKIGSRETYRKYYWFKNKGYGTKIHQEAILKYGITSYHRSVFVSTFLSRHQSLATNDQQPI